MTRLSRTQWGRLGLLLGTAVLLVVLTGVPPHALIQLLHTPSLLVTVQFILTLCAYLFLLSLLGVEGYALFLHARQRKMFASPVQEAATLPETETLPFSLLFPNPYEEHREEVDPSLLLDKKTDAEPALPIKPRSILLENNEPGQEHSRQVSWQAQRDLPQEDSLADQQYRSETASEPLSTHDERESQIQREQEEEPAKPAPIDLSSRKASPQERLEAFYQQQLAAGTPLERLTVDFFVKNTHVKRDTIGAFLRRKKAEAAQVSERSIESEPPTQEETLWQGAEISHPGISRATQPNEDRSLLMLTQDEQRALTAVADGMGGHGQGEEASQLVVNHLREQLMPLLAYGSEEQCRDALAQVTQQANALLFERNQMQTRDMGTTLTAAIVVGRRAYIVNIGDSRTYWQSREHGLVQVTKDHSTVEQLIEQHVITQAQRYTHPKRNEIFRSVGQQEHLEVDAFFVTLEPGDRLLLCSDGLWEMIPEEEHLARLLAQEKELPALCDDLLAAALSGGGKDNITALVLQLSRKA